MEKYQYNQGIMIAGGLATGYELGKHAYKKGNYKIIVAGFALSGLALGYAATDLVLRKTKIQEDRGGFDGIETLLYTGAGVILLAVSIGASWYLKNINK